MGCGRNVHLRCTQSLCDLCGATGRQKKFQHHPAENESHPGPWAGTEFFANYGEGYHSNDARSAVTPGSSPLARAKSYEVGVRSKPWGPEGVEFIATLAIGSQIRTRVRGGRRDDRNSWPKQTEGVEGAARGQVWGPIYFNGSVTWTKAEFRNGDAIPLAPEVTAYGAVLVRWPEGLTSQLQATYLGVRPLIEDRSVKSPSWIDFDLRSAINCRSSCPMDVWRRSSSFGTYSIRNGNRPYLHLSRMRSETARSTTFISCREARERLWAAWRGTFITAVK